MPLVYPLQFAEALQWETPFILAAHAEADVFGCAIELNSIINLS